MSESSSATSVTENALGGTTSTVEKSATKYTPYNTGKPWSEEEREYLRTHWFSAGRNARNTWVTCTLHLHRTEEDCRSEFRKLTSGKTAKKKIEAKKIPVKSVESHLYNAEQEIIDIFKRLHPGIKVLLAYLPEMGDAIEINLDKKKGLLMIQFDRDIPLNSKSVLVAETDAGNIKL